MAITCRFNLSGKCAKTKHTCSVDIFDRDKNYRTCCGYAKGKAEVISREGRPRSAFVVEDLKPPNQPVAGK